MTEETLPELQKVLVPMKHQQQGVRLYPYTEEELELAIISECVNGEK